MSKEKIGIEDEIIAILVEDGEHGMFTLGWTVWDNLDGFSEDLTFKTNVSLSQHAYNEIGKLLESEAGYNTALIDQENDDYFDPDDEDVICF